MSQNATDTAAQPLLMGDEPIRFGDDGPDRDYDNEISWVHQVTMRPPAPH